MREARPGVCRCDAPQDKATLQNLPCQLGTHGNYPWQTVELPPFPRKLLALKSFFCDERTVGTSVSSSGQSFPNIATLQELPQLHYSQPGGSA